MKTADIITAYLATDAADAYGLPLENGDRLSLAVIPHAKAADLLHTIADGKATEKAHNGSGEKIRFNKSKKVAEWIAKNAAEIYALPFTAADIETAYISHIKAYGKQPSGGRGSIFEDWTIKALNGDRNTKQNESRTEGGDTRINGHDIQIKYYRAGFALLK